MLKSLLRQKQHTKNLSKFTKLKVLANTERESSIISAVENSNCKKLRYAKKSKQNNTKNCVAPAKMSRSWVSLDENKSWRAGASEQGQYRFMSYNILAQDLLVEHFHLYSRTDVELLKWEHRLRRLHEEILFIRPDILCLQEMQYSHLKNLLKLIRGKRKLEYVFKKKTGHRTDGCAIIYDKDKFSLIEQKCIEYHKPNEALLNRENIALMAKFGIRQHNAERNKQQFVVATTHLLYNPRRSDVRMAQVQLLLSELTQFSLAKDTNDAVPVLLGGDFNFENNSLCYELLNSPTEATDSETSCEAQLHMCAINFGERTASTFQNHWITVDFILRSIDKLRRNIKICSIYRLPSYEQCCREGAIPNKYLGSDHYSLALMFSLVDN